MPKSDFIYSDPTISNFITSNDPTPYGIYDSDNSFISESVDVAKYVARKLGHPVMQIEMPSSSIYACFEEATSDYSLYINQYIHHFFNTLNVIRYAFFDNFWKIKFYFYIKI